MYQKKCAMDTAATAIPVPTLRARRGVIRLPMPKPEIVAIPPAIIETTANANSIIIIFIVISTPALSIWKPNICTDPRGRPGIGWVNFYILINNLLLKISNGIILLKYGKRSSEAD